MIHSVLQDIESFENSSANIVSIKENESANQNSGINVVIELSCQGFDTGNEYQITPNATKCLSIKQCLKDKIKLRRESQGAEEIKNLFEPPKQYPLTVEEKYKNEFRKLRNRKSATKSRLKRMAMEKQLAEEEKKLECENIKLLKDVKQLTGYKRFLQQKLTNHFSNCYLLSQEKKPQSVTDIQTPSLVASFHSSNSISNMCTGSTEAATIDKFDVCSLSSKASCAETCVEQSHRYNKERHPTPMINRRSEIIAPKTWAMSKNQGHENDGIHPGAVTALKKSWNDRIVGSNALTSAERITTKSETNTSKIIIKDSCEMDALEMDFSDIRNVIMTDQSISEEQRIKQIKEHLLDDYVNVLSNNNCFMVC